MSLSLHKKLTWEVKYKPTCMMVKRITFLSQNMRKKLFLRHKKLLVHLVGRAVGSGTQ